MSRTDQNKHKALEFPKDRDAFERRAFEAEDGCISAGGLAHRHGIFSRHGDASTAVVALATVSAATALAKLVELWRRQHRLTVEEFARRANLTEAEVVGIESGEFLPEPSALLRVSQVIPVSYDKLLHVAGHVRQRDERLSNGAVRFAAKSESMEKLTLQEEDALHEFVNLLAR